MKRGKLIARATLLGVTVLLCSLVFLIKISPINAQEKAQEKKIIYTTSDLKQDYEIISVISAIAKLESQFSGDPLESAQKNAWKDFMKLSAQMGADAVIGVRMDFQNLTRDNVGRLLMYGTAVKFK